MDSELEWSLPFSSLLPSLPPLPQESRSQGEGGREGGTSWESEKDVSGQFFSRFLHVRRRRRRPVVTCVARDETATTNLT